MKSIEDLTKELETNPILTEGTRPAIEATVFLDNFGELFLGLITNEDLLKDRLSLWFSLVSPHTAVNIFDQTGVVAVVPPAYGHFDLTTANQKRGELSAEHIGTHYLESQSRLPQKADDDFIRNMATYINQHLVLNTYDKEHEELRKWILSRRPELGQPNEPYEYIEEQEEIDVEW